MITGAVQRRDFKKPETEGQVRILDNGVATGYFIAKAKLPVSSLFTLFGLSPNCLEYASARCK